MQILTRYASTAALAVGLAFTVAGAEFSGANAQTAMPVAANAAAVTGEIVPVFVPEAVVQPLPQPPIPEMTAPDSAPAMANAASLHELVALTSTDGQLSPELDCLAGAIYFEARGEPLLGQLAVAEVIINRSRSNRFPDTYCAVVRQPGQFSFVRKGAIPQARRSTRAWQNAVAVARIAHSGGWQSHAEDALYFHANYVRPSWSRSKQALATIDSHIFYR
ncbi:MAG: cell wall hydrolase [Sphingomonadaceae bacterium]